MNATAQTFPTLISELWPTKTISRPLSQSLRYVALAFIGTALVAVSAKIQVPFWPVPMTMQTFAVLVIGMAYGWKLGGATLLLYLAEGAAGLPVFAAGGGLAYFAGPTTGYLVGFVVAATVVGWLGERGWDRSVLSTLAANFIGTACIFALGVAWLTLFIANAKGLGLGAALPGALATGLTPFIAGAAAKIALAAAVLPMAWKLVKSVRP